MCVCKGGRKGGEGMNASARTHHVREDAGLHPRGRFFTSADSKICPRVKSHPWDERGRAWTSGRRPRTSGR
jgi:hypothetical protein